MSNTDTIIEFLEARQPKPVCDDCISIETNVEPRQQVNQICRRLESKGFFARRQEKCSICGNFKICNMIFSPDSQNPNILVKEVNVPYVFEPTIPLEEAFDIREMRDQILRFCRDIAASKLSETSQSGATRLITEMRDADILPSHQANMMLTICGLRNSYSYDKIVLGENELAIAKGAWAIIEEWAIEKYDNEWIHSARGDLD